jgi:Right handed beta helix region
MRVQTLLASGLGCLVFATCAMTAVKDVDCNKGEKLDNALGKADPGDTLRVKGVCHERVTIATDGITLLGDGSAVLDGDGVPGGSFAAVVRIEGVQGVVLNGLTIRNGGSNGVIGQSGAAFAVRNSNVQDNKLTGIVVADGSTAEVSGSTMRNNTLGIDVFNRSGIVFRGNVNVTQNKAGGIETNGGATLEVRGGTLHADSNNGDGILVSNSVLSLLGFDESAGSAISASNNQGNGMSIGGSNVLVVGPFPPGSFSILASGNKGTGVFVAGGGSIVSPFGTLKLEAQNNAVGLNFGSGGSAILIGGLNVRNNDTGLLADNATTLTLVSIPPNPSAIQNNKTTDVDLRFGTRSTINGVAIGTLKCDATVLSRGSKVCP